MKGEGERALLDPSAKWQARFCKIDKSILFYYLKGNNKLAWMNLSHNKFSEKSGENLGLGISELQLMLLYK